VDENAGDSILDLTKLQEYKVDVHCAGVGDGLRRRAGIELKYSRKSRAEEMFVQR
jgi:hypothetical protein